MLVRRSPLEAPPPQPAPRGLLHAARTVLSHLLHPPEQFDSYEPVSAEALRAANLVARHCTFGSRHAAIVGIGAKPYLKSLGQRQDFSAITEFWGDEPWAPHQPLRLRPTATFTIHGADYEGRARFDTGIATFTVFPLSNGGRAVQLQPSPHDTPSFGSETTARNRVLHELFEGSWTDLATFKKLGHSRINLAYIGTDDGIVKRREFNDTPFGCRILPILGLISSPEITEPLHIQIDKQGVSQF